MAVVKEYVCLAHGAFESSDENPECPSGCTTIERAFFTPPGLGSGRTKNIDATLESLAKSHNLTDLGPKAMRRKALAAEKAQQQFREFCERRYGGLGWGDVPEGGTFNAKTKEVKGTGPGAPAAVAQARATGSVAVADQQAMVEAFKKPVMVRRDPQNLSLADAKAP